MNTQARTHRLSAGQVLQLPGRGADAAVLVQGEVLVQPPTQWLAGMVVVPPTERLVGPAMLPADGPASIMAVRDAVVLTQEKPSLPALLSSLVRHLRAVRRPFDAAPHA